MTGPSAPLAYLIAANALSLLLMGVGMLMVWQRLARSPFVRELGWSSIAGGVSAFAFALHQQVAPALGSALYAVAETANLVLLTAAVGTMAGHPLQRRLGAAMALAMFVALLAFDVERMFIIWPLFKCALLVALGLAAWHWMRGMVRWKRSLGLLVAALGVLQLGLYFFGPAAVPATALGSMLLRLGIGLVCLLMALTRTAAALQQSGQRFELMTNNASQGILVMNKAGLLYANPAAMAIYHCGDTTALWHVLSGPRSSADAARLYALQRQLDRGELRVAHWQGKRTLANGSVLWLRSMSWNIDWDGQPATQVVITDETEQRRAAGEALHRSAHDALTGLPNRLRLMQRLNDECARTGRGGYALIILNIDRFKLFNQRHGHHLGDRVLVEFAERLQRERQPMHLGGDEFALLVTDVDAVAAQAARLLALCGEAIDIDGGTYFIDVSIGMARFPDDGVDADAILRAANAAMHQAKRHPGSYLLRAHKQFEQRSSDAFDQEQALRRAIRQREIFLHYQPKVDAASGALLGYEALARWQRPGHGFVSPVDFIAVAERTGLIGELGALLLDDACRQIALWCGGEHRCVPVAVNVSPIQLLDGAFPQLVADALARHQVAPHLLTLEITESAAIDDLALTQRQLLRLNELGIKVALDDFGTGFSSLSMLRHLPLQTLKIDRALIDPLPAPDAMAVVRAVCQLAQALNLRVVAEGVETQAHADAALAAGCHELQGYLYARPLPHEQAAHWLSQPAARAPARGTP
jgi:diguanylate cyclase (GGDEF)-like protein